MVKLEGRQKIGIAITVLLVLFVSISHVISSSTFFATTSTTGHLIQEGVSLYDDSDCTIPLLSIQWGTLNPGDSKNHTLYVYNNNTVSMRLNMSTSNWIPANASDYISLTWDREDYSLAAKSSIDATLTLSIAANVTGFVDFAFDITIRGTQQ